MTVSYLLRKGWCCEPRFRRCTIRVKYQPLQVQVEKLGKGIEGRDDMKKFYPRPYTTQADIRMATATVKRRIVWARDKNGERRRSAKLNTVQIFYQMNHKLLRSRRVVLKREFRQLQGQRQRQPILKYIRVLLINLNCDYSNTLNFVNC